MLRLLIVDDIPYDKDLVKEIIDWKSMGIEVVGDFESGADAMASIDGLQPDIVLTDIDMPGMTGLELTGRLKASHPGIKVVFMSCHDDFQYAREALRLDVTAYVTKPVDTVEIVEVFTQLAMRIEEERALQKRWIENSGLLKEQLLRRLILENPDVESFDESAKGAGFEMTGSWTVVLLETDSRHPDETLLLDSMRNRMSKSILRLASRHGGVLANLDSTHDLLLLDTELMDSTGFDGLLDELSRIASDEGAISTMVCSRRFTDLHEIGGIYKECARKAEWKFQVGKGKRIDPDFVLENEEEVPVSGIDIGLKDCLFADRPEEVDLFVRHCFPDSTRMDRTAAIAQTDRIFEGIHELFLATDNSLLKLSGRRVAEIRRAASIFTLEEIRAELAGLLRQMQGLIVEYRKNRHGIKVESILRYIAENYQHPLTVQDIAGALFFSPNYLNSLFTKRMGMTIPEHIEQVRIAKAKEYLKNTDMKLFEIVERVGYNHLPHFNALFRKHTGMTPKEFREQA